MKNKNARGTGNKRSQNEIKKGGSIPRQCNSSEPRAKPGYIYYRSFIVA